MYETLKTVERLGTKVRCTLNVMDALVEVTDEFGNEVCNQKPQTLDREIFAIYLLVLFVSSRHSLLIFPPEAPRSIADGNRQLPGIWQDSHDCCC